ncbi:hypothetical protein V1478_010952 [Vespula squamosa]|uniref:Lipocalin n=1 Tax=Vespula squamosa TaxID=30214 RepID=A0ABD2AG29_VESSQ
MESRQSNLVSIHGLDCKKYSYVRTGSNLINRTTLFVYATFIMTRVNNNCSSRCNVNVTFKVKSGGRDGAEAEAENSEGRGRLRYRWGWSSGIIRKKNETRRRNGTKDPLFSLWNIFLIGVRVERQLDETLGPIEGEAMRAGKEENRIVYVYPSFIGDYRLEIMEYSQKNICSEAVYRIFDQECSIDYGIVKKDQPGQCRDGRLPTGPAGIALLAVFQVGGLPMLLLASTSTTTTTTTTAAAVVATTTTTTTSSPFSLSLLRPSYEDSLQSPLRMPLSSTF